MAGTRRHDAAARTRYAELKALAHSQRRILAGTPGTLKQRSRNGTDYWVREYIRVDGSKDDQHIGTAARVGAAGLKAAREEIALAKALADGSSRLRLLGYQRIDRKPAAVLAALFNHGLFEAGLTLVGSHAYGAILNELGLLAPAYRTEDIGVARGQRLAVAVGLREVLGETGLSFVPVPGMPSHRPSASFKLRGAETLAVDLLVPGRRTGEVVIVGELDAHAQTVLYLDFLIARPIDAVVLSPNQVIPVKVPAPERFVLHKLFSSQSRSTGREKAGKDIAQAAALAAVVEEETPQALREAFRKFPAAGRASLRRGARAAAKLATGLEAKQALEELSGA